MYVAATTNTVSREKDSATSSSGDVTTVQVAERKNTFGLSTIRSLRLT